MATADDMASVGIRELKHETSAILRRVRQRNETIDVTHRGRVVARLVPVRADAEMARRTKAAWRDLDELAKEIGARWPRGDLPLITWDDDQRRRGGRLVAVSRPD